MIRTLVEIQGGRVSIQETGAETTVTVTVDGAPSSHDPEKAAEVMADNYVRSRQRVTELERDLAYWKEQYNGREQARAGLESALAEALRGHNLLADRISKIRGAVHTPEILMALNKGSEWPGDHLETLGDAIRAVRQIVGSPESSTSQA
jgi:hypothetical protein